MRRSRVECPSVAWDRYVRAEEEAMANEEKLEVLDRGAVLEDTFEETAARCRALVEDEIKKSECDARERAAVWAQVLERLGEAARA